jgi:hypothetical protein
VTFGSGSGNSEPGGYALWRLLFDLVEFRRFDVNEEPAAPHSRPSYVHLILLCATSVTSYLDAFGDSNNPSLRDQQRNHDRDHFFSVRRLFSRSKSSN